MKVEINKKEFIELFLKAFEKTPNAHSMELTDTLDSVLQKLAITLNSDEYSERVEEILNNLDQYLYFGVDQPFESAFGDVLYMLILDTNQERSHGIIYDPDGSTFDEDDEEAD